MPPSAIVRFAHALGFDGFTQMQQVFRSRLIVGVAPIYKARLADEERGEFDSRTQACRGAGTLRRGGALSLVALSQSAHEHQLEAAIKILAKARDIYLLGLGGSFPVATHLAYVLRKFGRRVVLLDGTGGSIHEQSHPATAEDALVAISFRNYYPDTARLFPELVASNVPAISITDSLLSPIVEGASVVFEFRTCRSRPCARWWRRCAWCRHSRSASISQQNKISHPGEYIMTSNDGARALKNKIALVTRAGRGLGRAFAEKLAAMGANV